MGIIDRKERERNEMKRKILNSAKKLFLDLGYEKTSIRGIAEEIEYSPATIYLYYKDKNELLFALHQEAFQEFSKIFSSVITIVDPFDRLIQLGQAYLQFSYENPELYELMFLLTAPMETLDIKEGVWEDGRQMFELLESLIQQCQSNGYFKGEDVSDLSMMVWGTVHGLASIHLRRRCNMFEEDERRCRINGGLNGLIKILNAFK